jgi:hypothetical protein
MRTNQIPKLASETLVAEYLAVGLRQGQAIEEFDNRTYNRLYPKRRAIATELLSRPSDHWRLLLPLLEHADWQVRLNTAQDLRKMAPDECRRALETIDASNRYPYAADARLSLRPNMIFAGTDSA